MHSQRYYLKKKPNGTSYGSAAILEPLSSGTNQAGGEGGGPPVEEDGWRRRGGGG
jgi:hypothetical protein